MPKQKSAKSLKKYCLRSIFQNMDRVWCANYRDSKSENEKFRYILGPFDDIDAASVQAVLKILTKHERMSRVYLHVLIVPSLKEIDLSGATKCASNDIIDLICLRCQNIRSIDLTHCDRISPQYLLKLINRFQTSLTSLCLVGTKANDDVLEEIGKCCKGLVSLKLSMCKFSRKGIEKLFYLDGSQEAGATTDIGKSIRVLHMMGCSFENDVDFISKLLLHCKNLCRLTHFSLWQGVLKFCKNNPTPLKLTGVEYDMEMNLWDLREESKHLLSMTQCIPEIEHLSIGFVDGMNMEVFTLISGCRKTLKSLKMDWSLPYDFLLYVGVMCPNLDTLMITVSEAVAHRSCSCDAREAFENFISTNSLPSKYHKPWDKLDQMFIYWPPPDQFPNPPSSLKVLEGIFQGASNTLCFLNLHWMPDQDIDELITWSVKNKCFENLTSLYLHGSPYLSVTSLWELVMNAPVLKFLDFSDCRNVTMSEAMDIIDYIQDNNLALKFDIGMY